MQLLSIWVLAGNHTITPVRELSYPELAYDWVLKRMRIASKKAGKDQEKFLNLFEKDIKAKVRKNPELLRKSGWEK